MIGPLRGPSIGDGSDALIWNLCANTEGLVPQLVLDGSMTMLVANELGGVGGTSSPLSGLPPFRKVLERRKGFCHALLWR